MDKLPCREIVASVNGAAWRSRLPPSCPGRPERLPYNLFLGGGIRQSLDIIAAQTVVLDGTPHFFFVVTRPGRLLAAEIALVIVAPCISCLLSFTLASELAYASFKSFLM